MPRMSRGEIMDFYRKRGDEIRKKEGREPSLTDADPRDLLRMVELDRTLSPEMMEGEKVAADMGVDIKHTLDPDLKRAVSRAAKKLSKMKVGPRHLMGAAAGVAGLTGAASLGSSIGKGLGEKITSSGHAKTAFMRGFYKAAEVSKEDLKATLRKHEERETPEQERAESAEEQRIEREAGVEPKSHEKKAFWAGFNSRF